jgi:lantibiotic biosynthesis protein
MDRVRREPWQPILTGSVADRAWRAIDAIAADRRMPPPGDTQPGADGSLATGSAGQAIFYTYLSRSRAEGNHAAVAERHLRRALHALEHTRLPPGLFEGFAGIGWTYTHLYWRLAHALHDETIEPVDSAVLQLLRRKPWDDEYDLIGGLVGYGVYALEQEVYVRDQILELVVARLAETSERRGDGTTWLTPPSRLPSQQVSLAPDGYYNLGVAHGVPGVVAMLGSAVYAGQRRRRLRAPPAMAGFAVSAGGLLTEAVAWLREQRQAAGSASAYPSWVAPGRESPPSRLAWCYGDAGLAAAWLVAARAVGHADWERDAMHIAHGAAARARESSGVGDAGLCHGAAGVAHIFNRLFQATGDEMCRDAAQRWFAHALEIVAKDSAFADGDAGFLTGASGVGLALLGACTDVEPEWDRALLLDVPDRETR